VLRRWPGPMDVYFNVCGHEAKAGMAFKVAMSEEMIREVEEVVGTGSVKVK
jgi:hypothetical protein